MKPLDRKCWYFESLALCVVVVLACGCAHSGVARHSALLKAREDLDLTISLEASAIDGIVAHIGLHNVGSVPHVVPRSLEVGGMYGALTPVIVALPSGEVMKFSAKVDNSDGATEAAELPPGATARAIFTLRSYYALAPGRYLMWFVYEPRLERATGDWPITKVSNAEVFEIEGPGEERTEKDGP